MILGQGMIAFIRSVIPANKKAKMLNISFAYNIAASDKLIVIFKNQTK